MMIDCGRGGPRHVADACSSSYLQEKNADAETVESRRPPPPLEPLCLRANAGQTKATPTALLCTFCLIRYPQRWKNTLTQNNKIQ